MNQEKIGNFIKKIRKDNNLTQKELADKLGVTFQAVSKWENGKNIPDIQTLQLISKEFNIDINELLDGNISSKTKKNNKITMIPIIVTIIIVVIVGIITITNRNTSFEFKTISSKCSDFRITGSAAYNKDKTAIYISNIEFCGKENNEEYKRIEYILYENYNDTKTKINSGKKVENITLEDYLKDLKINVDNYSTTCKKLTSNTLSLEIKATTKDGKTLTYNIPIKLNDSCK